MGTNVNGTKIGGHSSEKIAFLNLGHNDIIAGGKDSPFHLAIEIIENNEIRARSISEDFTWGVSCSGCGSI